MWTSSWPSKSAEISAPGMSSTPSRRASARASGRPLQRVVVRQGEGIEAGRGHPPHERGRRVEAVGDSGMAVQVDAHATKLSAVPVIVLMDRTGGRIAT